MIPPLSFSKLSVSIVSAILCFPCLAQATHDSVEAGSQSVGAYPYPDSHIALGHKDPTALQIVQQCLLAFRGAQWSGFDAMGTIRASNGRSSSELPATLSIDRELRSRLDIVTAVGNRSIRMDGPLGGMKSETGAVTVLPPATSSAGLVSLPELLSTAVHDPTVSLIDEGITQIDDRPLHRVAYIRPQSKRAFEHPSAMLPPLATDFYFDESTHFLVRSVDAVHLQASDRSSHQRVLLYSDFRAAAGVMLPYRYSEFLDGRFVWEILLTEVSSGSEHDAAYFRF